MFSISDLRQLSSIILFSPSFRSLFLSPTLSTGGPDRSVSLYKYVHLMCKETSFV